MIETLLAGAKQHVSDRTKKSLLTLQSLAEARSRLEAADAEYEDVEGEILELEEQKSELEQECWLLEEIIPLWEAALQTPETLAAMEIQAAVNNPNQMRLDIDTAAQVEDEHHG